MKLALIGAGNLGSIIASEIVEKSIIAKTDLLIVERAAERNERLRRELGCQVVEKAGSKLEECEVIVLAVKPQEFSAAAAEIRPNIKAPLILSVVAGVPIARLRAELGDQKMIVRSMPNLPSKIGKGMTVFTATKEVTSAKREVVRRILGSLGESLEVDSEALIDAATAVSASGPGFIFYLIESMVSAAQSLGFSADQAELLTYQTFSGSIDLWNLSPESAAKLREMVTSKGGTTEAGLQVFKDGRLAEIFEAGIKRAAERAAELSIPLGA